MATSSSETESSGNEKQTTLWPIRNAPIGHHGTPETRGVGST
jgi:hypothetical protein